MAMLAMYSNNETAKYADLSLENVHRAIDLTFTKYSRLEKPCKQFLWVLTCYVDLQCIVLEIVRIGDSFARGEISSISLNFSSIVILSLATQ